MSSFVEIGEVIRPVGDESYCVVISKPKDGVAKCIWKDGTVGTVFIENITSYGKLFVDIHRIP